MNGQMKPSGTVFMKIRRNIAFKRKVAIGMSAAFLPVDKDGALLVDGAKVKDQILRVRIIEMIGKNDVFFIEKLRFHILPFVRVA